MLSAVRHPEWIARDWEDYMAIAAGLVRDPAQLAAVSNPLRYQMVISPLMDHSGQAARFGSAVRECWVKWCTGTVA